LYPIGVRSGLEREQDIRGPSAPALASTSPPSASDYFIIRDGKEGAPAASRVRCSRPATVLILRGDAIQIATADNPLTPIPIANAIV
jgi:hypothetical protein